MEAARPVGMTQCKAAVAGTAGLVGYTVAGTGVGCCTCLGSGGMAMLRLTLERKRVLFQFLLVLLKKLILNLTNLLKTRNFTLHVERLKIL